MVQFYSEYNEAMARYEQGCREANASNSSARVRRHELIEDSLVEGGIQAVEEYEAELNKRWNRARCNAEYDGIRIGYGIVKRARARLAVQLGGSENA